MTRFFTLFCLMLMATPTLAQEPVHAMTQSATSQDAVTLEKFDLSIEQGTDVMVKAGAVGERYIHHDIAFPAGLDELRQMHGYALLLLSAWSQDAAELPLKTVYLSDGKGLTISLPLLGSVARTVPDSSLAGKVYGRNRRDSFYLLPLDKIGAGIALQADFSKGRTGFIIGNDISPPNYGAVAETGTPPIRAVVERFMDREYPGFGIPIAPEFP